MRKTLISTAFLLFSINAVADPLDKFKTIKGEVPGCAVAIIKGDSIVNEQYYGYSNLSYLIKNDEKTTFNIGSISKHMTAAIFFRLEQDGVFNRSDLLSKYYPTGPKWFKKITIGQLLTHESGLPDYLNDPMLSGASLAELAKDLESVLGLLEDRPIANYTIVSTVLKALKDYSKLEFEPGSEARYSNTGYLLLADIIENNSEKTFKQWLNFYILDPYEMNNTSVHNYLSRDIKWTAVAYTETKYNSGNYKGSVGKLLEIGDGGILTTIKDYSKWMIALKNSTDPESPWHGFLPNPEKDHTSEVDNLRYQNGLNIFSPDGHVYSHSGRSIDGMDSTMWIYPKQDIAYIQLCNYMDPINVNMSDIVLAYLK
ncbi:MAG: serine hydrolase [Saccharospirillaceae bacterium]|nr:beta-lactamase family protein [Pseudomonadales bacterium]NRB81738.1 serine hydrolase [Saccharospirillaceae bacterium]